MGEQRLLDYLAEAILARDDEDYEKACKKLFCKPHDEGDIESLARLIASNVLSHTYGSGEIPPDNLANRMALLMDPKAKPSLGYWQKLLEATLKTVSTATDSEAQKEPFVTLARLSKRLAEATSLRNKLAHPSDWPVATLTSAADELVRVHKDVLRKYRELLRVSGPDFSGSFQVAVQWMRSPETQHAAIREIRARANYNPFQPLKSLDETDHHTYSHAYSQGTGEDLTTWTDGLLSRAEKSRMVLLFGKSGCGKSSFLRAGLLPAAADNQRKPACFFLSIGGPRGEALAILDACCNVAEGHPFLLVIDQFERLINSPEERPAILTRLTEVARRPKSHVVVAARDDMSKPCSQWLKDAGVDAEDVRIENYVYWPSADVVHMVLTQWKQGYGGEIAPDLVKSLLTALRHDPHGDSSSDTNTDDPLLAQILFHRLFSWWRDENPRNPAQKLDRNAVKEPEKHTRDLVRTHVKAVMDDTSQFDSPDQQERARKVLVSLVRTIGQQSTCQPRSLREISDQVSLPEDEVEVLLAILSGLRLVTTSGPEHFALMHDGLARETFHLYGLRPQKLAGRFGEALHAIETLVAATDASERWKTDEYVTGFMGELVLQFRRSGGWLEELSSEEREKLPGFLREHLLDSLQRLLFHSPPAPIALDAAAAFTDAFFLLVALFELPANPAKLSEELRDLLIEAERKSETTSESTELFKQYKAWLKSLRITCLQAGLFRPAQQEGTAPQTIDHDWLKTLHTPQDTAHDPHQVALLKALLRSAQEQGDMPFSRMLSTTWDRWNGGRFDKALPPSRIPLWRTLLLLGRSHETETGRLPAAVAVPVPDSPRYLLHFDWRLVPGSELLRHYQVQEDKRTYRGLLIHIPAGEHAMRNQRAARQLLVRTAAIERRARKASPGFHEADTRLMIGDYANDTRAALERVLEGHIHLLRDKNQVAWVLLEAQEYGQQQLLDDIRATEETFRKQYPGLEGRILADPTALKANRKDYTRQIAGQAGVPQPDFTVLEAPACSAKGHLETPPEAWADAVMEQVRTSRNTEVFVKPVVTEFLKGATEVRDMESLRKAWLRLVHHGGAPDKVPAVVVEERLDVAFEILTHVVPRNVAAGSWTETVTMPPVFYHCMNIDLEDPRDVPRAFTTSWVFEKDGTKAGDGYAQELGFADGSVFAGAADAAREYGEAVAGQLYGTLRDAGYEVDNHFLSCEWLVDRTGEVYLNEIKPTQLDKGIITHYAMTHSDSDLLVRNLFGLPLPAVVSPRLTRNVGFLGSVVVDTVRSAGPAGLRKRQMLTGYGNIEQLLAEGTDVNLYPDKMRSVPYAGRRMGVAYFEADSLAEAIATWKRQSTALVPHWAATD